MISARVANAVAYYLFFLLQEKNLYEALEQLYDAFFDNLYSFYFL